MLKELPRKKTPQASMKQMMSEAKFEKKQQQFLTYTHHCCRSVPVLSGHKPARGKWISTQNIQVFIEIQTEMVH